VSVFLRTRNSELLDGALAQACRIAEEKTPRWCPLLTGASLTGLVRKFAEFPFVSHTRLAKYFLVRAVNSENSESAAPTVNFRDDLAGMSTTRLASRSGGGRRIEDLARQRAKAAGYRICLASVVRVVAGTDVLRSLGRDGWTD